MSTSYEDLTSAFNELLKWKEEIGIPALEELKVLKVEKILYINQEILYKSQIKELQQELNQENSAQSAPSISDRDGSSELPLNSPASCVKQISREEPYLFEKLYSFECMNDNSQFLNEEIDKLLIINQQLQDSNEEYMRMNEQLRVEKIASNEKISNLHTNVNVLYRGISQMGCTSDEEDDINSDNDITFETDVHIDTDNDTEDIPNNKCLEVVPYDPAMAEKEEYYSSEDDDEYIDDTQFAENRADLYANKLLIQKTITFFNTTCNANGNLLSLNIAQSTDILLSPKMFASAFFMDDYFVKTSPMVDEKLLCITAPVIVDKDKSLCVSVPEKVEEEEYIQFIDDINIYDIEIEGLNTKLMKYKTEFHSLKKKNKICEKNLVRMETLYDKLHEEQQILIAENESGFFKKLFCC